jgi:formamidopyrimidine-DNA glycosylase
LYSADEFAAALGPQAVGPDALAIDADQLRSRLKASRREVKVALLDQRAIAGIGNLYAAEILHQAGVHPRARCHRLSVTQWNRIADSITDVLQTAITYEGSTLSDGTYRNALNKSGGYQNEHRVYAREDQLCPTCRDDKIMRIVQSQRSTFFCPTCQSR